MKYPILTPRQTMELLIKNDEHNVRDVCQRTMYEQATVAAVIADCAQRLFQARAIDASFGIDNELERAAERNLRIALVHWRDR